MAPRALRWWEKGGVSIIGKWTSQSFVSPWVSDCHALVGGTNVRRGDLLFKWYSDPFTMQRLLMKFSWVVSTPIAHVLLFHATGNVEMGLVAQEHERGRRHVFQERFTSCLASVKITFSEPLHYCHFAWMKAKFFVKNSSHRAV